MMYVLETVTLSGRQEAEFGGDRDEDVEIFIGSEG